MRLDAAHDQRRAGAAPGERSKPVQLRAGCKPCLGRRQGGWYKCTYSTENDQDKVRLARPRAQPWHFVGRHTGRDTERERALHGSMGRAGHPAVDAKGASGSGCGCKCRLCPIPEWADHSQIASEPSGEQNSPGTLAAIPHQLCPDYFAPRSRASLDLPPASPPGVVPRCPDRWVAHRPRS